MCMCMGMPFPICRGLVQLLRALRAALLRRRLALHHGETLRCEKKRGDAWRFGLSRPGDELQKTFAKVL